jgi:hypothetical protein
MIKSYHTYLVTGDFPITENTPYLYLSREACIKDLIAGIRLVNEGRIDEQEWENKKKAIKAAFEIGDSYTDEERYCTYVILICRIEERDKKRNNAGCRT